MIGSDGTADRAKRLRRIIPNAKCYFTPPTETRGHARTSSIPTTIPLATPSSPSAPDLPSPFESVSSLDFGQYIDFTPLTAHPNLPLETVMEMFKKLGPRVVLVELKGKVCGLVTVKDVLKYQFKVESEEHPRRMEERREDRIDERVWGWFEVVGRVLGGLKSRVLRRGGVRIEGHAVRIPTDMGEDEVELVETAR